MNIYIAVFTTIDFLRAHKVGSYCNKLLCDLLNISSVHIHACCYSHNIPFINNFSACQLALNDSIYNNNFDELFEGTFELVFTTS